MNFGATKELTMTVICKTCEHQYGAWRSQCPACGTSTPVKARVEQFRNAPRVRAPKPARITGSACCFCRVRGAKGRCPICNELVHGTCLSLHTPDCEQFQRDVILETVRAMGGAK